MRKELAGIELTLSMDVLSSLAPDHSGHAQTHGLLYPYKVYISRFIPSAREYVPF